MEKPMMYQGAMFLKKEDMPSDSDRVYLSYSVVGGMFSVKYPGYI